MVRMGVDLHVDVHPLFSSTVFLHVLMISSKCKEEDKNLSIPTNIDISRLSVFCP
jgi:hypothetical protein